MNRLVKWLCRSKKPAPRPRPHTHEWDCCWDCDAGVASHPIAADDPACARRFDQQLGRCVYGA